MAQGDSIVGICNAALIALGEDLIVALTDNTKRAILCAARYDPVRRMLLRSHPWNFAKAQANLAAAVSAPLFDWDYGYPLPADFIRVFDESSDQNDQPHFEVIGTQIFSDDAPPFGLIYVADEQDPTVFDAAFVQLLGLELAAELCEPLTQSTDKMRTLSPRLEEWRAKAQLVTSQEGSSKEWDEDLWLRARR